MSLNRRSSKVLPAALAMFASAFMLSPVIAAAQSATPAASQAPAAQQNDPTLGPSPMQDKGTPERHGRKYKAPPETAHIEVTVFGGFRGDKPITNAAVIFHPLSDTGKDEGSYEVKTDPDGKATIDVIPQGSTVILQVIAPTYNTYGDTVKITNATQAITVKMQRPRTQYSTYTQDNNGVAQKKPGVLEPAKPVAAQPPPTAGALSGSAAQNNSAVRTLSGVDTSNSNASSTASTTNSTSTANTSSTGTKQ